MRGYMFEITTDVNDVCMLNTVDLYEEISSMSVDYIADVDDRDRKSLVNQFLSRFADRGADVSIENNENNWYGTIRSITPEVKRAYYKERFEKFQKLAAEIDLKNFSEDSNVLYEISAAVKDDYGDMVYLDGYSYTLDYFIRNADPDTLYYVGNVILLH